MDRKLFKGAYGIALTPFKEDGSVDFGAFEANVEKAAASPLDGLVVCGSTGEFTRLSFDENIALMKLAAGIAGNQKRLVCGATAGDSYTANQYVEHISKLGADGALIAPPYYFALGEDEILAYYEDIVKNNAANLPVVGYNIPQCTNRISVRIFERLLDYDCVKGFKNSWNDMGEISAEIALRDEKRHDVSMLTGLDACLYGTLSLGGDGLFTAITYLMPEIMTYIIDNHPGEKAWRCQSELIKLINLINRFTFPYGYRALSKAMGQDLGEGRAAIPLSVKKLAAETMPLMKEKINKLYCDCR